MKKGSKILVAEDSLSILSLYQEWFKSRGYAVVTAKNVEEAMPFLADLNIRYILSDGNGWDIFIQAAILRECFIAIQTGDPANFRHYNIPVFNKTLSMSFITDEFLREALLWDYSKSRR